MDVHWAAGPVVGQARLYVSPEYTWPLEVNVVEVKLDLSTNNLIILHRENGPKQSFPPDDRDLIVSAIPRPAMEGTITVHHVTGPNVNGVSRGEDHIKIGFIQTGRGTKISGTYDAAPNTSAETLTSDLQDGTFHIDIIDESDLPWYNSKSINLTSFVSVGKGGLTAPQLFEMNDTPSGKGTLKRISKEFHISSIKLVYDFNVYLAVQTTDTENDANLVYTQRASSQWGFDGSGSFTPSLTWTLTGKGLYGKDKTNPAQTAFSEVTSGTHIIEATQKKSFNVLLNSQTWK
ncbi:hypothetical protein [Prosthecobacter sp.]|uniref:hypothetical protein n=1 Tax=Prosthecobacter sp. TaxID=1965333 RepID=UPI003784FBE5